MSDTFLKKQKLKVNYEKLKSIEDEIQKYNKEFKRQLKQRKNQLTVKEQGFNQNQESYGNKSPQYQDKDIKQGFKNKQKSISKERDDNITNRNSKENKKYRYKTKSKCKQEKLQIKNYRSSGDILIQKKENKNEKDKQEELNKTSLPLYKESLDIQQKKITKKRLKNKSYDFFIKLNEQDHKKISLPKVKQCLKDVSINEERSSIQRPQFKLDFNQQTQLYIPRFTSLDRQSQNKIRNKQIKNLSLQDFRQAVNQSLFDPKNQIILLDGLNQNQTIRPRNGKRRINQREDYE